LQSNDNLYPAPFPGCQSSGAVTYWSSGEPMPVA